MFKIDITKPMEMSDERHLCIVCNQTILEESKGLVIINYVLDNFPKVIQICKLCSEKFAVGIMSGSMSFSSIGKIFGLLKGRKG